MNRRKDYASNCLRTPSKAPTPYLIFVVLPLQRLRLYVHTRTYFLLGACTSAVPTACCTWGYSCTKYVSTYLQPLDDTMLVPWCMFWRVWYVRTVVLLLCVNCGTYCLLIYVPFYRSTDSMRLAGKASVPAGEPFVCFGCLLAGLSYFPRWSVRLPYLLVGFSQILNVTQRHS